MSMHVQLLSSVLLHLLYWYESTNTVAEVRWVALLSSVLLSLLALLLSSTDLSGATHCTSATVSVLLYQ
jgi:hypothetical protein